MNKLITALLISVFLCSLLISCRNYDEAGYVNSGTNLGITYFDGTTLDYLKAGDPILNVKYDSMMKVINKIPDFKFFNEETGHTVFAIPDTCFQTAITKLNNYRQQNSLGKNVYLDDLLIEPFEVEKEIDQGEGLEPIKVIIKYDYRASLDTLLCRYMFDGVYDSKKVLENEGGMNIESYHYGYQMNLSSGRNHSEGLMGGGNRYFKISDTNNSVVVDNWAISPTLWNDIYTTDGVVHVLTLGHEFGFDNFVYFFKNRFNEYEDNKK